MGQQVSGHVWHQTHWELALAAPSSINQLASDVLQTPGHNVHRPDAANCLKCHLGLEFTTKILTLRFTHNLLLCSAGYYLCHCLKIGVHYKMHRLNYQMYQVEESTIALIAHIIGLTMEATHRLAEELV